MNRIQSAASDLISARQKGFGSTNIMLIDSSAQLIFERGSYALAMGNYDSALIFIDAAIQVNPNKSYYYYARGECYFSKNQFEESIKAYSLAIGLSANYQEAYYKRGLAKLRLGKAEDAIVDFTRTIQYNPQFYLAQKGIGDAYFSLNDYKKCAASLETCLGMSSLKEAHSPRTTMEIYSTIGKAYYRIKNYPKALENYRKYLAFHPNEIPSSVNYEMGNIYMNMGKYDSAYSYLNRSYQTDTSNGYFLYSMASCIYLRGNIEESLKWFERSFRTNALERSFVDQDTLLGSLQDDKRFKDLKKKYL
jgi:tetratricopeptide (TPR) repeat protein